MMDYARTTSQSNVVPLLNDEIGILTMGLFQEMSKMEPIYPFPLCNKENVVMKAASQNINCN